MKDILADAAVNLITAFTGVEKNIYEEVTSFNSQNCMTDDTEIIIVGTITPTEGMRNGYFYTSPRNRIYGYIDAARGTELVEKKRKLTDIGLSRLQKEQIIETIKNELQEQKIAFLDVIESAIRLKDSYSDSDIKCYTLDYPVFSTVPKNVKKVICNSRLAEECYNVIRTEKDLPAAIYLSQRDGTKESWINELKRHS